MSVLKKIMLSLVVFIMVATGTALSFVPFYNRTPFRIGVGIILAVILYIVLLKSLVWRKEMSRYDDIINLPHHVSPTRQRMSMHDRAAQFAPFAALVGYNAAVAETARLTESRPELDEQEQQAINECLAYIADHIHEQPEVRVKYFISDEHKSGGAIIEVFDKVKKISATDGTIVMADGCVIPITDVMDIVI